MKTKNNCFLNQIRRDAVAIKSEWGTMRVGWRQVEVKERSSVEYQGEEELWEEKVGVGGAPREECNIRGRVINKVAEEKGILEVKQNTCNNEWGYQSETEENKLHIRI